MSLFFVQGLSLLAQSEADTQLPETVVSVTLREQSFFTDRVATAVAYFDSVVSEPEEWTRESDTCTLVGLEVVETPDSETHQSATVLRFLPKQVGVVTLPSLEFESVSSRYRTDARQILVGEPSRSTAMSLSLEPAKRQVYVGEPLRIDLTWDCRIEADKLRGLSLSPEFFQDPSIQVVIPRNTDPEKVQVGLPIGGRRVIAKRLLNNANAKALGTITLPLFIRFDEPGRVTLAETRLDCSVLATSAAGFGRYAAHFNNGLFEAVDPEQRYERVYTSAPALDIEVLPLPENLQGVEFSGLFEPLQMDVSVQPTEMKIGDLIELEVKLSGDAPHGMLALPNLSQQPALRERFIVDDNYGRLWHEQGTIFRTRFRVLSTSVDAFPALRFQVFDSVSGAFATRVTEAIPMDVQPSDGREFVSLKSFEGAAVSLTNQPEGIWHNLRAHPMNDLLNTFYGLIRIAFWPLLLLGPVAFGVLLPVIREWRRRALDPRYRFRVEAYAEFRRCPSDSKAKWSAFLRFMALTFDAGDRAWTRSDSEAALREIGSDEADVDRVLAMHRASDAEDFSETGPRAEFQNLDALAKRISRLAAKGALMVVLVFGIQPTAAEANEWKDAESLFAEAQAQPAGSETANLLYVDAALKFQAAARANQHPGASWYNAGNAWFQSGHLGRSIAAYRQAELYRPFDSKLLENLAAARALTLNDIPEVKAWWERVPAAWLRLLLVGANFVFWGLLLLTIRYRQTGWVVASVLAALVVLGASITLILSVVDTDRSGVVVVDAVYGKKGPGYQYANAFHEPLHDGAEFVLLQTRERWGLIQLPDARQCWLPLGQVEQVN